MIAGGILLVVVGFDSWIAIIYGVIIAIVGAFILFNKKEDKIERRRDK